MEILSYGIGFALLRGRRPACAVLPLLCISLLSPAADQPSEYQVKAAFLLNFTKFVDWPPGAFERPDSPLAICILGGDPFGSTLDRFVEGEMVNDRKLVVRRIARPPSPRTCQVLFISSAEKEVSRTLAGFRTGVLTVGEGGRFLKDGGIIAFVLQDRHVRFDINQRAAAKASLAISARLLNVARSVER